MEEEKIKYDFNVIRKGRSYLKKTMREIVNLIADHTMKRIKYDFTDLPYHISFNISMCGTYISILRRENGELETECHFSLPSMNFALNRNQSDYGLNYDKKAIMKDLNEGIDMVKEAKELVKKYICINEKNIIQRKVRTA